MFPTPKTRPVARKPRITKFVSRLSLSLDQKPLGPEFIQRFHRRRWSRFFPARSEQASEFGVDEERRVFSDGVFVVEGEEGGCDDADKSVRGEIACGFCMQGLQDRQDGELGQVV
jgi:hypothetical protein